MVARRVYINGRFLTQSLTGVCWGYNGAGQIGDGTNNNAYVPVKITLQ